MRWKVAEAKQKFSALLRAATEEPQEILNRDRLVGVVIDPETFEQFRGWAEDENRRSLAVAFEELRRICAEEDYIFEPPTRRDRPNPFANVDPNGVE